MKNELKIGVVGLGFMGSTHLQAWKRVPEARVVAVVSSDPKKRAGDLSGVGGNLSLESEELDFSAFRAYPSYDQVLNDPEVDAVDLCLPTHLHLRAAEAAFKAGKHVLVEKPMALDGPQCEAMIEAGEKAGRFLMVAQVIRFWPDYHEAWRRVSSGGVGELKLAVFRRRCGAPAWAAWQKDLSQSGGGVFDLLIHDFDFCVHALGMPRSISAQGLEKPELGIDWIEAELDYPDGPSVFVSGGWQPQGHPFAMEFTLTGSKGALDFHSSVNRLRLTDESGSLAELEFEEGDGFRAELEAFAQACGGRPSPETDVRSSAAAVNLALAAIESRRQGGNQIRI